MNCSLNGDHSAAPLASARPSPTLPALISDRRQRRRGPRSQIALLRRSLPRHRRTLPDTCLGESRHLVSVPIDSNLSLQGNANNNPIQILHESDASANNSLHGLCIYSVNIQCLLAHLAELQFHLDANQLHVVCIQET